MTAIAAVGELSGEVQSLDIQDVAQHESSSNTTSEGIAESAIPADSAPADAADTGRQADEIASSRQPIKLFVGSLPTSVRSNEVLRAHFEQFGEIADAIVRMKTLGKGEQKGYGFITVHDDEVAKRIMAQEHVIDGTTVPAPTLAKSNQQQSSASNLEKGVRRSLSSTGDSGCAKSNGTCLKAFVGGLSQEVTEEIFKQFFGQFGELSDTVIMYDYATRRPRGFGFVTYTERASLDKLLTCRFYELNGCRVEVKEAVPREHMRKEGLAAQAAQNKEFRKSGAAFDEASQAYGYEGYAEQAASPSANYRSMYPSNGSVKAPGSPPSYVPVADGAKVPMMTMMVPQYHHYVPMHGAMPVHGAVSVPAAMYHGMPTYDAYGAMYGAGMFPQPHYQPIMTMPGMFGAPAASAG
mmetsp:Transcript_3451/g.7166  ORF Transcript_3451/g.7166 Transcript_3451/m.7166 type:complete len:409 (+) Transcript_3451:178-1404(+)